MKLHRARGAGHKSLLSAAGMGALVGIALAATPASAALPNCTVAALNNLQIPQMTFTNAIDVPAAGANPEYCDVYGDAKIDALIARFRIQIPSNWNRKLIYYGVGGTGGQIVSPSANAVDIAQALPKGYATAISDTGHQSTNTTDDSFAILSPGVPNIPAIVNYNYRAAHEVTKGAKLLLQAYNNHLSVRRAYYDGCSGGGRGALNAATHYPDDYDGIVAGDPGIGQKFLMTLKSAKSQFDPPTARIPSSMLPMIDAAVYAACDAVDGVADGLIQNPAMCSFDPQTLVCKNGNTTNCLSQDQAQGLRNYFHPLTDKKGKVAYGGYFPTDLSGGSANFTSYALGPTAPSDPTGPEPWGTGTPARGWALGDTQLKYFYALDGNYNSQTFPMTAAGVVEDKALKLYNKRIRAYDSRDDDPKQLKDFLHRGGKLIMYNGSSDPSTSPVETIRFYEQLAKHRGGYRKLHSEAQLFMVPGMVHCSGGPGPNSFDTLTALDTWVETGKAPDTLLATKYKNDSAAQGILRQMPLCKFPEQAKYLGGNVNVAASWTCPEGDERLLQVGPSGVAAGLKANGKNDDDDDDDDD